MSKNPSYAAALRISTACLVCCLALNFTAFFARGENLRSQFLRLHVIAASDSQRDQQLKLQVRDAVLLAGKNLFDGSVSAEEAEEKILPDTLALQNAAEKVLRENGCTDRVCVTVQKEYFAARQYGDITLPSGFYEAVKVVIGDGNGKNWWCVMFPPMCLPAAEKQNPEDVFSEEDQQLLHQPQKFTAKLKIAEWYYKIKDRLTNG